MTAEDTAGAAAEAAAAGEQIAATFEEVLRTSLTEARAAVGTAFSGAAEDAALALKTGLEGVVVNAFTSAATVVKTSLQGAFTDMKPILQTTFTGAAKDAITGGTKAGELLSKGFEEGFTAGLNGFAERAGLGTIVAPLLQLGTEFKTSLEEVKTATSATSEQMREVRSKAEEVGLALPTASAKDAAAAMAELAKSGFTVKDSMAAAMGTVELAGAASINAAEAAGLQANVLKSFGLDATSAGTAADVLASASEVMGAKVTDVASALAASGTGASALGVSMTDTAAAMAVLGQAGTPAAQAGSMLASMFTGLSSGTEPAKAAIEQLGLTLTGVDGQFVGMPALFGQLQTAAQTMAPGMYEAATSALFGADAVGIASLAAEQGASAFDSVAGAIGRQGAAADLAAQNVSGASKFMKTLEDGALFVTIGISKLSDALSDLIIAGFGGLKAAGQGLLNFYREWADIINSVAVAIGTFLLPVLVKLGVEYTMLAAKTIATTVATTAQTIATNVQTIATNIATAATNAWKYALTMLKAAGGPLIWITTAIAALAAGLVYFFTQTETGKKAWAVIWEGMKSAVAAAWEFIKPVWDGFLNAMKSVGETLMWLWGTVIQPVFGLIGALIQLWWNGYVMTVWSAFTAAVQLIGTVIEWLWSSIIQPVFGLIGEFISAWWNGLVKPMWDGFVAVIQFVGEAINWWWTSIVQPVFGLLGELISAVWNNIIKPMWDSFVASIQLVGDIFTWLWSSVIQPLLGFIGETISAVWNNIIKPIWDSFVAALQLVGSAFQAMWDQFIRPAWELLQAGIQAGWAIIQTAIETGQNVFNTLRDTVVNAVNTILEYWNKIKDIVGTVVDTVGKIGSTVINGVTSVIPGFATGGHISGPGTGTSDSIVARLSDGEFVVNAKATSEHLGLLHAINSGSMSGSPEGGGLPGFAQGGLVSADQLVEFAKGVEGAVYNWGGVNWGDCSGAISALANYVAGLEPFASRFATGNEGDALVARGFQLGNGPAGSLRVGWYNGGQFGGHTAATLPNGVNFEMGGQRGNGQYGGMASGANDSMFTDHAFFQFAAAQMAAPTGVEPVKSNPATVAPATTTPAAAAPTDNRSPMDKRQASTFDSIQSNFTKAGNAFKNGMFGDFLNVFGIPDLDSTPLAKAATAWQKSSEQFNKDQASQAEWLKTNNTADPATSTSIYWDTSRGPEQLLDLPGRLANALMGRISPTRYDNGGWLQPGLTLVENKTGQPEPVFNPQQWAQMSDLTQSGSNDNSINIETMHTGMTAEDFRREINLLQRERSLGFVGR
ncbi:phage tail tape measure protein [Nocardia altamirensis]|uniref:phage tail tape measure protein n=1 Tax=Nocardia altamirensis TaxID=472158 RepID=UPI0008400D67|nr:phage tail tape measure protein [Nocardia altamirensis]